MPSKSYDFFYDFSKDFNYVCSDSQYYDCYDGLFYKRTDSPACDGSSYKTSIPFMLILNANPPFSNIYMSSIYSKTAKKGTALISCNSQLYFYAWTALKVSTHLPFGCCFFFFSLHTDYAKQFIFYSLDLFFLQKTRL